jgi:hypothetical protein
MSWFPSVHSLTHHIPQDPFRHENPDHSFIPDRFFQAIQKHLTTQEELLAGNCW